MILQFLHHKDIDYHLWDQAVAASPIGLPYAYSWYLDIVSENRWDGLVDGNYERVMPLVWNTKLLGVKQLFQPVLSQQLGVFGEVVTQEHIRVFLEAIPRQYKYVQINLNGSIAGLPLSEQIRSRTNLILPLHASYDEIRSGYAKSLRKRLRVACRYLRLQEITDAAQLVRFYRKNLAHKVNLGIRNYPIIERLIQEALARNFGRIYEVQNPEGASVCTGLFLETPKRIINLFGASNEAGRASYAMHFLIDQVIQQHAGQDVVFDFEGSEISGIAAFFRSFGSREESYFEYRRDRLPLILRMVRKRKVWLK